MKKTVKESVLVVVAHPDDELLGVGGTLLKHAQRGDSLSIVILGDGETSRDKGVNVGRRAKQAKNVGKALKAKFMFLEKLPDNAFDSIPLLSIVKVVERHVYRIKPDIVYTHHSQDLNVDHRLTFEAVLTACRPLPKFFVKKILAFETLSSSEWQVKKPGKLFCPTEYNDISAYINGKIKLLKIYEHEMRKYPHPRSYEGVRFLAQYRGLEVGCAFAEAFEVVRSVNLSK